VFGATALLKGSVTEIVGPGLVAEDPRGYGPERLRDPLKIQWLKDNSAAVRRTSAQL
jgi:hypothetical protein